MSKKYYSYTGAAKDPYLLHEVNDNGIISYKKKGFIFLKSNGTEKFPLDGSSVLLEEYIDDYGNGACHIQTGKRKMRFYIFSKASEFIHEVKDAIS